MSPRFLRVSTKYSFLVPCFLLPWAMLASSIFKIRPWPNTQPVFIALIFLCFFLIVGLLLNLFSKDEKEFDVGLSYTAVISLGIAVWSIVVSFFSHVPWLAWTGGANVGMGILWYIMLGVMIIGFKSMLDSKYSNAFIINIAVAAFTICCLNFFGDLRHGIIPSLRFNPYFINEHIIFIGISLVGLGFLIDDKKYRNLLFVLGAVIIAASTNRFAFVGILGGAILGRIAYYVSKLENPFVTKYSRYVFAFLVLLVPVFVYIVSAYMSSDYSLFSLYSRYCYWKGCISAIFSDPFRILIGFGWGSYTDTILSIINNIPAHTLVHNISYLNDTFLIQDLPKTWSEIGLDKIFSSGISIHSHNQFIESWLSAGVFGVLLFSSLLVSPILLGSKRKIAPVVFCVTALSFIFSGWYEVLGVLPFMALFWAASVPNISLPEVNIKKVLGLVLPSIAAILLAFGLSVTYYNLRFHNLTKRFPVEKWSKISITGYLESSGPGGNYLGTFARIYFKGFYKRKLTDADVVAIDKYLTALHKIKNPSLETLASILPLYDFLMNKTEDKKFLNLSLMFAKNHFWEEALKKLYERWYCRADLMLPYFDWLLSLKKEEHAKRVIENMLIDKGGNPILEDYLERIDEKT